MDALTLKAYSENSDTFLERYAGLDPYRIHELIDLYFLKGKKTVDIGCASGRDLKVLKEKGFKITGVDIVPEFVDYCRKALPNTPIIKDSLPKLAKLKPNSFSNVLLCAVIMHITSEELNEAITNITRVTQEKGRIILSYREAIGDNKREADGRLFNSITMERLIITFKNNGARLVLKEKMDQDFHGKIKVWQNLVFEKE